MISTARRNVAARLLASADGKPDADRIRASAAAIAAGEDAGCWSVKHELARLEMKP